MEFLGYLEEANEKCLDAVSHFSADQDHGKLAEALVNCLELLHRRPESWDPERSSGRKP